MARVAPGKLLIGREAGQGWPCTELPDLWCATEEDAKRRAKQLVDGQDVELWYRDHKIATFRPNDRTGK
jgi:hypothetical protein